VHHRPVIYTFEEGRERSERQPSERVSDEGERVEERSEFSFQADNKVCSVTHEFKYCRIRHGF